MIQEKKYRDSSIDTLKGLAAILVLFGHVWGAYYHSTDIVTNIVGTIHNASFFLAMGMIMAMSNFHKYSNAEYIKKKVVGLLFPFVEWVLILTLLGVAKNIYYGQTVGMFGQVFTTINYLWFLPVFFVVSVVIKIVKKEHILGIIIILGVLMLVVSQYSSALTKLTTYFVIAFAGRMLVDLDNKKRNIIYVMAIVLYLIGIFVCKNMTISDTVQPGFFCLLYCMLNICGSIGTYGVIKLCDASEKRFRYIARVGKCSLEIYILQIPFNEWIYAIDEKSPILGIVLFWLVLVGIAVLESKVGESFGWKMLFKPGAIKRRK